MRYYISAFIVLLFFTLFACENYQSKSVIDEKIYPKDSILIYRDASIFGPDDLTWVNEGYVFYTKKKNFIHSVRVDFNLEDTAVQNSFFHDSLKIAEMLIGHFRKKGIAHFAGQRSNMTDLRVYLYTEPDMNPLKLLSEFPLPCNGTIREDPGWDEYQALRNR